MLLTPLFFVLPYGFMTPPSGPGGLVTQMIPLFYPSSLYQKKLFEFGYSREGEEEDSEEGGGGLVGKSGDEYYSVLCASLGCMWLIKGCVSRECVHIRYYISRLIGTALRSAQIGQHSSKQVGITLSKA